MNSSRTRLSDTELQREREALRRGLLRVNTAALLILAVIVGLAVAAILQA